MVLTTHFEAIPETLCWRSILSSTFPEWFEKDRVYGRKKKISLCFYSIASWCCVLMLCGAVDDAHSTTISHTCAIVTTREEDSDCDVWINELLNLLINSSKKKGVVRRLPMLPLNPILCCERRTFTARQTHFGPASAAWSVATKTDVARSSLAPKGQLTPSSVSSSWWVRPRSGCSTKPT